MTRKIFVLADHARSLVPLWCMPFRPHFCFILPPRIYNWNFRTQERLLKKHGFCISSICSFARVIPLCWLHSISLVHQYKTDVWNGLFLGFFRDKYRVLNGSRTLNRAVTFSVEQIERAIICGRSSTVTLTNCPLCFVTSSTVNTL